MLAFDMQVDAQGVRLSPSAAGRGLLGRLFSAAPPPLDRLPAEEHAVADAIAQAEAVAEGLGLELELAPDALRLPHPVVARLGASAAAALGLPAVTRLTLSTDVQGIVGRRGFALSTEWRDGGRRVRPRRTGAILETAEGRARMPAAMLAAIEIAEGFDPSAPAEEHWAALARFRRSLDPDVDLPADAPDFEAKASMTQFLSELTIAATDTLSMAVRDGPDGLDFDPVPLRRDRLRDGETPSEADAELSGDRLRTFQRSVRARGPQPAHPLAPNDYVVVEPDALPVLEVMHRFQRAPREAREAFIRNPRPHVADAVAERLHRTGALDGLTPAQEQEVVDAAAEPAFVETKEYSERVVGIGRWSPPELPVAQEAPTTWLPEVFADAVRTAIEGADIARLTRIEADMAAAADAGRDSVEIDGVACPTDEAAREAVRRRREALEKAASSPAGAGPGGDGPETDRTPIVIETRQNTFELEWRPEGPRRAARTTAAPPSSVKTPLLAHQRESLDWAASAWATGLPGVLNADEQGLGKTLQTIAFLAWLRERMATAEAPSHGPILVVAPTSLLENWEAEVARHMTGECLGGLVRLYGPDLARRRVAGGAGKETADGVARLDLEFLHRKTEEGRGHEHWLLTTYTTLTNYQHSLARLSLSALVFDEIQALKNPATLAAAAGRAMRADFRIGLTGTPVENRTVDLWAVMDQLAPGALGTLKEFAEAFGRPEEDAMRRLHAAVFRPAGDRPPLGLRRLKSEVARDLRPKRRLLHPRAMPPAQAARYDEAREKLAAGGTAGALAALQHIRSVSAHPGDPGGEDADFIAASARLAAAVDVLDMVRDRGERALLFIEDRGLQHRVGALLRRRYDLERIDVINGATPVRRRQAIVDRFQRHPTMDGGFDLLILGPRAAGVGLTLTAATHVIHLSRWWNPAVEEQCNDRTHRIGQSRPVTIHVPLALHEALGTGSFDALLHDLMRRKRRLAGSLLFPAGDTEDDVAGLQRDLSNAAGRSDAARDADHTAEALAARLAGHPAVESVEATGDGATVVRLAPQPGGATLMLLGTDAGPRTPAVDGIDATYRLAGEETGGAGVVSHLPRTLWGAFPDHVIDG